MPARRRFHETESDDSVALILPEEDEFEDKKYTKGSPKWNLGGFLQNQLIPGVYSTLTQQHIPLLQAPPQQQNQFQTTSVFQKNHSDKDLTLLDNKENEDIQVMTARDRTLEFSNAIRTLQSRNISRAVNIKDAKKASQLQSYSEFMMIAKHVGKNIASTYSKLEKLTLCKYNFVFNVCIQI